MSTLWQAPTHASRSTYAVVQSPYHISLGLSGFSLLPSLPVCPACGKVFNKFASFSLFFNFLVGFLPACGWTKSTENIYFNFPPMSDRQRNMRKENCCCHSTLQICFRLKRGDRRGALTAVSGAGSWVEAKKYWQLSYVTCKSSRTRCSRAICLPLPAHQIGKCLSFSALKVDSTRQQYTFQYTATNFTQKGGKCNKTICKLI